MSALLAQSISAFPSPGSEAAAAGVQTGLTLACLPGDAGFAGLPHVGYGVQGFFKTPRKPGRPEGCLCLGAGTLRALWTG